MKNMTTVERTGERELTVSRVITGPARLVFEAWTNPALLQRWWVPRSSGLRLIRCAIDARTGGSYRLAFDVGDGKTMEFYGTYVEVSPPERLVWTNEEGADVTVTTVTFTEQAGATVVTLRELYPSKEALDAAMGTGQAEGTRESFEQLEELIVAHRA